MLNKIISAEGTITLTTVLSASSQPTRYVHHIKVIVPSLLIVLFNIKAGRLLFKSPVVGLLSALPTSIFIFRGSLPLVSYINNWIENKINKYDDSEVIDTDSVPVDD